MTFSAIGSQRGEEVGGPGDVPFGQVPSAALTAVSDAAAAGAGPGAARGVVVGIFGPTASGKSALAEALADALGTDVVSADAMQVYRGLPILTNQPERPTRLVGILEPSAQMSVGAYAPLAHAAIDELLDVHGSVVVAGGTGLYFRAALGELDPPPPGPPGARERWERVYDDHGAHAAHDLLRGRDPAAADAVHPNDRRRVVRALELTDIGASLAGPAQRRLWSDAMRHPTLVVGLDVDPDVLEERIVARTGAMLDRGVVDEVRRVSTLSTTSAHVIGLQELRTLEPAEAETAINVRTRRYAAYQRKWLRRLAPELMLDGAASPPDNAATIVEYLARNPRSSGAPPTRAAGGNESR